MNEFNLLSLAAVVLAISFFLGLVRVFLGPTNEDRMLSVQLVGTTAVALLVLFSQLMNLPAAVDVALILALLAAVAVIALTRQQIQEVDSDD
ncbi:MAG: monovalent cation/H+ antiporter complex subunit F [Thioalkalispiraceae bacterium]|jgi:multicomponent Na+:H+ antiporter subunit F